MDKFIRPKIRGIPDHRNIRKSFSKKPNAPMIRKTVRRIMLKLV